ncbi:MAG: CPBP family intramembrane metalloprotease [Clostridium sp.]|nr:CPBP family intramembrane metalloprotease [Clostridium sp.]
MKRIFRNNKGEVRWGYKLASFLLIQEILAPIAMLLLSAGLINLLFPVLQAAGVIGSSGAVRPEYAEAFQNGAFVIGMVIQNAVMCLFFLGAWKLFMCGNVRSIGLWGGDWLRQTGAGFAFGAVMIAVVCGGIYLTGGARIMTEMGLHFSPWLAAYLVVFVMVGFGEEIAFRGYAMGTLRQTENSLLRVLLPAVLFGLAHSTNANFSLLGCANIILAGILLGILTLKSGRLWLGIGFHIAWNFFQGCVFGFGVSGIATPSVAVTELTGSELLNGGAFGPEGSLVATVVILAGIALTLRWFKVRRELEK